ncbi:MAG: S-layer homology domain-containing protein, partial [Clostridia bacterium]|nr:S-layer homology domain-containing protein [Clostridia bacterium]
KHALFVGIETADGLTFAPDMTMSRAMFVTVLGRLAEMDPAAYDKPSRFTDVVDNAWYAPYVAWAESSGIVLGYDTGAFGIGDEISVEQAAVIMARFAKADGLTVFDASYKNVLYEDAAEVSDWAAADVGWCLYAGIHAPENGRIEPKNDASRALVAQMLYRYSTAFRTN